MIEVVDFRKIYKTEALVDGLKEFARIGLVAVIPVLILQLEQGKFDYRQLLVVFAIAVLKGIDRGIHEYGKKITDENLEKSILRF